MNQAYLKNILSAKFDFDIWKDLLEKIFPKVEIFTSIAKITDSHVKDGGHVGNVRLDDGRSLAIFNFEVADNVLIPRNRRDLRNIAASFIDQDKFHGAIAFYHSHNKDNYRLTFIAKQTYFNESGELVKKETAPKRYTFLLGPNEPCTTAASRLKELADKKTYGPIYLTDVTDAFSVERLNKEFFNGYKAQYKKFIDTLSDTKSNRDYVKKLLGRLVFLQFLQKKGWMGVPVSNAKWEGGDKNYLSKLVDNYANNNRLLSDVLEPLFFKTLNEKRNGDIADGKLGENIKIPYLNGGLFDKDRIDELDIDFPYSYFKDLMDFFSQYNFTIDENDPDDSEVGIDPEMLGHIFENLLEDNKDKGAFYTPKEIVQYMCRQSVIQYLKTHEPSDQYADAIEQLINDSVVSPMLQSKSIATRFIQLLKEVKVCDPAIGSGAFPMGILYVLYHAIHHLHSHAEPHGNFDSTQTKRDIIQNNIFGVDIEQGAVDIARLRFWLALVVDAEEPQPLPNLDYKITCGNSLLSRYPIDAPIENVFVEYNKGKKENEKMTLAKYKELVSDYTNTSNHQTKELFRKTIEDIKSAFKTELSNQFKERLAKLRGKVVMLEGPTLFGERTKAEKTELKKLKDKLNILEKEQEDIQTNKLYVNAFEWRFEFPQLLDENGKFIGFDIVIGNPPYNELRDLDLSMQTALKSSRFYDYAKGGRLNMFQFFYPLAINVARDNGIVSLITQNSILAEDSALGNRKLFFAQTDILSIDSFPERDNKNLRVFESAKMSVCICTLRKNNHPDTCNIIPINVWHSRFMQDKHELNITVEEIMEMYPEDIIIPISSNEKFSILKEIKKKSQYHINASAGEIDMTKYKSIFNTIGLGTRVITGAQIQRYYITNTPSQGDVIYIDDSCKPQLSSKRKTEISQHRIVLQRITGVDSKVRIIATLINGSMYCANSTNYIANDKIINIKYLLGVLNSSLVNFFIKQTSTNTNITAKVLNSIPIAVPSAKMQEAIVRVVDYIMQIKSLSSDIVIDQYVDNEVMARQFENVIDALVYELYFSNEFKQANISFVDSVLRDFQIINVNTENVIHVILDTFTKLRNMDNDIRNNLKYMSIKLESLLAPIINI
ncbi:MAG: N-6 DNA methylase [Paludibacteraceae bacterium]|nr:N-6 DNA methylase [Paludibacteraceae bacterium]MBO5829892.1 N-6 DNA methylase [Paludibacteraceae bacterium]